jgi:ABC-type dipeptide/oligopeptide/nickel transport system permease component
VIGLVARRIGWALVVAWFAATVTFAMVVAIPADPAATLLGPHRTPEAVERVRAHYCLDDGVLVQYGCWIGRLAHGDLGESYRTKRPVSELLAARVWPTVQLALAAIVLSLAIGVPLGVIGAARRGRWPDRVATVLALLGQSAPRFFVGTVLLYLLAYRWGWFPITGYGDGVLGRIHHIVLPALTLATIGAAYYARVVRSELVGTLREDYVRTAHAKGLPERAVLLRHALRPALGPLVTLVGVDLGVLIGGAVVVEEIFAWPGLGRELLQAILLVDVPLILGVVLVSAFAIAAANLVADLLQLWLDPRQRDG